VALSVVLMEKGLAIVWKEGAAVLVQVEVVRTVATEAPVVPVSLG
jgi:hypothetical protein